MGAVRLLCLTYEFSALLGYVCLCFWFGKEKIRLLVLLQCLCKHSAMQNKDLAEMENGLVVYIIHLVAFIEYCRTRLLPKNKSGITAH